MSGDIHAVTGNPKALAGLRPADFSDEKFGVPTVADIFKETCPRPGLPHGLVHGGVETIADLKPRMVLEGTVTNVAAFGAFVDVGVHQDGLVHVSAMANTFVKDPRQVAKPGDIVKVKVLAADVARKRIALTMRLTDPEGEAPRGGRADSRAIRSANAEVDRSASGGGPLADALRRAAEKGRR